MPAINWNIVATSAATAIIVTLAIEYFAKPRLEARKERILELLRARRELLSVITKLSLSAKMYGEDLPATAPQDLRRAWRDERDRHYQALQQQSRQLMDDVARYAHAYPRQLDDVLIGYATTVHGIMLSMRPRRRKAAHIADLGTPVATALEVPPRWKIWSFVRMTSAQQQVRQMLTKIGDESVPSLTPAELASQPNPGSS
jgi:hypothetical protein